MISIINITTNVIMLSFNITYEICSALLLGTAPCLLASWVATLALGANIYRLLPFSLPAISLQCITSLFSTNIYILLFCDDKVTTFTHYQLHVI